MIRPTQFETPISKTMLSSMEIPRNAGNHPGLRSEGVFCEKSDRPILSDKHTVDGDAAPKEPLREDAPGSGMTTRDTLAEHNDVFSQSLSQRCQELSKAIDTSGELAVALFVCQFHPADLSESLLTLLRGIPGHRATYVSVSDTRRPSDIGGSLLNKSA